MLQLEEKTLTRRSRCTDPGVFEVGQDVKLVVKNGRRQRLEHRNDISD